MEDEKVLSKDEQKAVFKRAANMSMVPDTSRKSKEHYEIDKVLKDKITEAAAIGLNHRQIASKIGFGHNTLYRKIREDERISQFIEAGRAGLIEKAMKVVVEYVEEGDLRASCWLLGHLEKMSERDEKSAAVRALESVNINGLTLIEQIINARKD